MKSRYIKTVAGATLLLGGLLVLPAHARSQQASTAAKTAGDQAVVQAAAARRLARTEARLAAQQARVVARQARLAGTRARQAVRAEAAQRAAGRIRMWRGDQGLLRGLNLDGTQQARLRDMAQARQQTMRDLSARLAEARQRLVQAQQAETLDEAAIRQHATGLAEAEAELAIARARARQETLSVLTPEQLKTVRERQAQAAERQKRMQELRQQRQQKMQELRMQSPQK